MNPMDFMNQVSSDCMSMRGHRPYLVLLSPDVFQYFHNQLQASIAPYGVTVTNGLTQLNYYGATAQEEPSFANGTAMVKWSSTVGDYSMFVGSGISHQITSMCPVSPSVSTPSPGAVRLGQYRHYQPSYTPPPPPQPIAIEYVGVGKDSVDNSPKICYYHDWKEYFGFHLEHFWFCTKCDEKRDTKP
jgi:hypothetical protein